MEAISTMPASVSHAKSVNLPKRIRILYWSLTLLFALAMFMDGIGGILRVEAGREVIIHLGYPLYVLTIFGVAKILGMLALVQTKYQTIKEWAYAGFTINFIGAVASRTFVGDSIDLLLPPLVMLVYLFLMYYT